MTKKRNTPASRRTRGTRNYEVGYARPPKRSQFRPGQSGNPKGRPKGAKNEATIIRAILNRQIEIRDGSRTRKVSVMEGMLLSFAQEGLKGNPKAAAFLLNRYRLAEGLAPEANELDQDGREVFDALMQELEAKLKKKKVKPHDKA